MSQSFLSLWQTYNVLSYTARVYNKNLYKFSGGILRYLPKLFLKNVYLIIMFYEDNLYFMQKFGYKDISQSII